MKIEKIDIYKLTIPFHKPFRIAIGVKTGAHNIVIKITTDTGIVGWGEASPAPYVTGGCPESIYQAAQYLAKLLIHRDPLAIEALSVLMQQSMALESSTRCAFDLALYDIAAKAAGMPLYQFLGGELREIRTDMTIGIMDTVEETAQEAKSILAAGFTAVKVKVGRKGLEDVKHVAAVREVVGLDFPIRIDSNQGWDYPEAVANINAMTELKLEYSEQPLKSWDYTNLARLRDKVDLPICADESIFDEKDALKLITQGSADYLNIKIGKSGGIHTGLKINAIAEAAGCKCMIGCYGESRLALGAAAHLALAKPNIAFLDLDSAYMFKSDPVIGGISYDKKIGGLIHMPNSSGHGASFVESFLEEPWSTSY